MNIRKQWTVKQLSEEFGLSYARVNHLIRQYDGDVEQIALSREKSKKADPTKKAPKTGKSVEKNQNKNNLYKVKLSYELNDELIEESININQFSSLKIKYIQLSIILKTNLMMSILFVRYIIVQNLKRI